MDVKKTCSKHWKYVLGILLAVAVNVAVLIGVTLYYSSQPSPEAIETLVKVGSQGSEVRAVQTKLTELGFFKDKIDGIFGSKTKAAVIAFQKSKGLTADGIAGTKTLAALGITSGSTSTNNPNNAP